MGASTPFEGMSHEAMLAWLDQANSGTVQGAADRLAAAAKEIRKIAEDLKVRPQWVEWKGAGADAFRTWSADLANATLRLGDFSEGSSKWLGHASNAIASAQASIPRDQPAAQANLAAAKAAHNDPDAAMIARKSTSELAALEADKEKVRQEAVAQMRKLGQAYEQSATQMNVLERPKFPPPPSGIAPEAHDVYGGREYVPKDSSTADRAATPGRTSPERPIQGAESPSGQDPKLTSNLTTQVNSPLDGAHRSSRLDIDSVATLPQAAQTAAPVTSVSSPSPAHGGETSAVRMPPSAFNEGLSVPTRPFGTGRPAAGEALPARYGQATESGRSNVRTPGISPGIVGGRPVPAAPDRPNGSIPKGTVVGAEGGSGATRPIAGAGSVGHGRPGAMPAHGPLTPRSGVIGGNAQQSGRAAGPRSVATGAERGGVSGGRPVVGGATHGGNAPRDTPKGRSRREAGRAGSGYSVEDDETWLRDDPRAVPPVID